MVCAEPRLYSFSWKLLIIGPRVQLSQKQSEEAKDAVERSRFWLGEELYTHFRDYYNSIMEYMTVYAQGNVAEFQQVEARTDAARQDIIRMRDKL